MLQGAGGLLQRQQRMQDQTGVMVVDAALIAFAVTGCGEIANDLLQRVRFGSRMLQRRQIRTFAPLHRGQQQAACQIFSAIQLCRLRIQSELPVGLQFGQFRVVQRFQEVGAGQVDGQLITARQQGQVQCLGVHAEAMAWAQSHHVAARFEQVAAVTQRAHGLVTHALQTRFDIVGLDAVAQFAQALSQLTQLEHQRVAGEEGIELVGAGKALGALGKAVENAGGRIQHRARLALAFIQQRLLVGFEGFDQLFALGQDVAEELFVFAELAFQFLQLHQQARHLFVGALRVGGHAQRTGDGLREQRELGRELRHRLGGAQGAATLFGAHPALVQTGIDGGNGFHDARAGGGIVDLQAGHQGRQHVQVSGHATHSGQLFIQYPRAFRLLRGFIQQLQALAQWSQRALVGEELARGCADAVVRLLQGRGHCIDHDGVDVAIVADGQQVAALGGDRVERLHERLHVGPVLRLQPAQQSLLAGLCLGHGLRGLLADALDLLVLVQHRLASRTDLAQQTGRAVAAGVVKPMVRVEHAPGVLHQALVALYRNVLPFDGAGQVEQVGDAAHQLGIADAPHERVARRPAGRELVAAERGLPDLHRVDAGRFRPLGMEQHHAAIVHEGIAMSEHRILQHALDGVVDEQRRTPTFAFVEDVQNVLAVGRTDGTLELHALHRGIEGLVLAALQVVTTGENDAVVFRQLHAGLHDGVVAHDRTGEHVVDQPAPYGLTVRQHLEQHQ